MRKQLLTILALLIGVFAQAQTVSTLPANTVPYGTQVNIQKTTETVYVGNAAQKFRALALKAYADSLLALKQNNLGFTPYNSTNPAGYITQAQARTSVSYTPGSAGYNSTTGVFSIPTNTGHLTNGSGFITLAQARAGLALTTTGSSGAATYNSTTGALNIPNYTLSGLGGQTQLNGTGFVKANGTSITYDNSTYLTGITSAQVTGALGFTPYNASNPNGYITSSALSGYLPLSGGTLTGALGGTSAAFSANTTSPIASFLNTNTAGTGNGVLINVNSELGTDNYVLNARSNGVSRLYVREDGNVGIGTASPQAKLNVVGQDIYLTGETDNRIRFSNYGFTGNNMGASIGYIYGLANTQEQGNLAFYTNPNFNSTGSLTERMRITSGGNVLIGTTTDNGAKLQVEGGTSAINYRVNNSNGSAIGYLTRQGIWVGGGSTASNLSICAETGNGISFYVNGSSAGPPMFLNTFGSLGINNTSPSEKLDVSGNVKATSFIKSGGTSSQFLKADGSVDGNTYLTSSSVSSGTYTPTFSSSSASSLSASGPTIYTKVGNVITISGGINFYASSLGGSIVLENTTSSLSSMPINGVATYSSGNGTLAYAENYLITSMVGDFYFPSIYFNVPTYGYYTIKYVITIIN